MSFTAKELTEHTKTLKNLIETMQVTLPLLEKMVLHLVIETINLSRKEEQPVDEIEAEKNMHSDICLGYRIERCGCRFDDDDRYVKEAEQSLAAMAKLIELLKQKKLMISIGCNNWLELWKDVLDGNISLPAAILVIEEDA